MPVSRPITEADVSELTVGDFGEFQNWLIEREIKNMMLLLPPNASIRERMEAADEARRAALSAEKMEDLAALQYLVWLSLRHKLPEITLKEAGDLITKEIIDKVSELALKGLQRLSEKKTA